MQISSRPPVTLQHSSLATTPITHAYPAQDRFTPRVKFGESVIAHMWTAKHTATLQRRFITAACRGDVQFLRDIKRDGLLLLALPAQNKHGNNGLMLAAKRGHFEFVKELMEVPEVQQMALNRNHYGNTAAHQAQDAGYVEIAEYIWDKTPIPS